MVFMGVRGVWAALWCVLVLAARVDATSRGSLAPVTHRRLADDESAKATGGDAKGSWSEWRYRSNEELANAMDALHTGPCAGISKLTTIGTSVRGVEMRAMEVSTQPGVEQTKPGIMLVGNMHGDEPVGRELIIRFARLLCIAHERQRSAGGDEAGEGGLDKDPLDEASAKLLDEAAVVARRARVFLVPTMNPDGFSAKRRNNAASVDLNRDFPDQFNEPGLPDRFDARQPETAAMMRFSEGVNATAALNFHEGALVANYPYDAISGTNRKAGYSKSPDDAAFRRLAKVYARAHPTMATAANEEFPEGITNGARWYPLWGGMQDWHYLKTQTMDVTVEVNERKWPDESSLVRLWTEHAPAMMAYAKAVATTSTTGKVTDSLTGEPVRGAVLAVAGVDGVRFTPSRRTGYYARFLPPGRHEVTASAPGYYTQTRTADAGTRLDISLRRMEDAADADDVAGDGDHGAAAVVGDGDARPGPNPKPGSAGFGGDTAGGAVVGLGGGDTAGGELVRVGELAAAVAAAVAWLAWRWRRRKRARLAALREGTQLSGVRIDG